MKMRAATDMRAARQAFAICALLVTWSAVALAQPFTATNSSPSSVSPDAPPSTLAPPGGGEVLRPPGSIPVPVAPLPPPQQLERLPAATPLPPLAPATPPGHVALYLSARFGRDMLPIPSGIVWRVYSDRPDSAGAMRLVREDKTAAPTMLLPAGGYIVHASMGQAQAVKKVQLRAETVREVFEIPAGGIRIEGKVGDTRIPSGQIHFSIYKGSQFEPGEKRPLSTNLMTGEVMLLQEGTYHIVSNYGDSNAVVRSDIRVQAGRVTDVIVTHRAAIITLKLVAGSGGDALANTQWSVLTPGGDVIKESIGAFPRVVLAEGDYRVIARNEGRSFQHEFNVVTGVDREIAVVAQ